MFTKMLILVAALVLAFSAPEATSARMHVPRRTLSSAAERRQESMHMFLRTLTQHEGVWL